MIFLYLFLFISVVCLIYTAYELKHAPSVDPNEPFLRDDIDNNENKKKEE